MKLILLVNILLMIVAHGVAFAQDEVEATLEGKCDRIAPHLLHSDYLVLFGKVIKLEGDKDSRESYTYTLEVLADSRKLCRVHDIVSVRGSVISLFNDAHNPSIPVYSEKTYALLYVRATKEAKVFAYVERVLLPIGIYAPHAIPKEDVDDVVKGVEGMAAFIPGQPDGKLPAVDKCAELLREKSYSRFALGVSLLAVHGTKSAAEYLVDIYDQEDVSPEKIVWVDFALGHFVPDKPGFEDGYRHSLMLKYLRRFNRKIEPE